MVKMLDRFPGRQWLLPVLVMLLVLGHACELPAYADLAVSSHATETSHHSGDGHAEAELISCDAVGVVSSANCSPVRTGLDISVERPVVEPLVVRAVVARSLDGDAKLAVRPPLFLLFASFLI